jgi:hypothetical protein
MKMAAPLPRHNYYCKEHRCAICLEDAFELEIYLREKCGGGNNDWLARYRTFMDKELGRSSETEFGWFDPIIFQQKYLDKFINNWMGQ